MSTLHQRLDYSRLSGSTGWLHKRSGPVAPLCDTCSSAAPRSRCAANSARVFPDARTTFQ